MKPVYHLGSRNFGDALPPVLANHFGYPKSRAHILSPKVVTVGSLLQAVRSGDTVWGTGSMRPDFRIARGMQLDVRAVRGPLTRQILLDGGYDCPEVYGDPAIFLPEIYPAEPTKQYSVGFITHYVDTPLTSRLPLGGDRIWINIAAPPKDTVRWITSCDCIVSSSLHGLIAAEAYGIPSAWMLLSDKVGGDGFKFRDYAKGSGRETAPLLDWRESVNVNEVVPWQTPSYQLEPLRACCPLRSTA